MSDPVSIPATTEGHRQRLRSRFLSGEESALSEEALLELLLSFAIQRQDVKPLAQTLLAKFGSLSGVLRAEISALTKVNGIKENTATLLKLAAYLCDNLPDAPETVVSSDATGKIAPSLDPAPPAVERPLADPASQRISPPLPETKSSPSKDAPKLQVSNGYTLDAAKNAQLLSFIAEQNHLKRIGRKEIIEGTGLSDRQAESLASMGAALGLIVPRTQVLSPLGRLVVKHDLFLDSLTTLEFCHFLAATNPRNLVWYLVFNELLVSAKSTDQSGWSTWLREKLAGQFTDRSLIKHIAHEVRFLLDAYTVKNFKKLNLLSETPEKTIALRRYTALQPHTLAAMIYFVGQQHEARLVPFSDLHAESGSPGRVFGLDPTTMRQMVETLHQKAWIRFEVRHGLDQVRLLDGFTHMEFLAAAYENRAPQPTAPTGQPAGEHLLL